jgi:hypothetical protein
MLSWFPTPPVATASFSCSPPELNFLDPYFIFMYVHYNHCHRATAHLQFIIIIIIIIIIITFTSPLGFRGLFLGGLYLYLCHGLCMTWAFYTVAK